MIVNKKEFTGGLVMLGLFFTVLIIMFQPIFSGHNAMEYLDKLYNSISKGSVYYIPELREESAKLDDKNLTLSLVYPSRVEAQQAADLFDAAGATVRQGAETLSVTGSLGGIMRATLADADLMYVNNAQDIEAKYDLEARRVMYNWWTSLKAMDKSLKSMGEFEAAKIVNSIEKKAVEATYNYYEVEPVKIMDEIGLVIFSLIFYVIYTLWYGFAILFAFEGWGLRLSH